MKRTMDINTWIPHHRWTGVLIFPASLMGQPGQVSIGVRRGETTIGLLKLNSGRMVVLHDDHAIQCIEWTQVEITNKIRMQCNSFTLWQIDAIWNIKPAGWGRGYWHASDFGNGVITRNVLEYRINHQQ